MAKKAKKPLKCPFCGKVPDISEHYMCEYSPGEWNLNHNCNPDNWSENPIRMCIDLYAPSPEELIDLWNKRVEVARRKPKKPDVDPGDDFFGAVCNCAVRYSLGRQSYMPGLVQDFLRPLLPKMNAKTLAVMERDIRQAPSYGDPAIDRPGWLRFLSDVRKVMDDKGIDPVH